MSIIRLIFTSLAVLMAVTPATAEDLVVFSAAAMKSPLLDLSERYTPLTGDRIHFVFGTAGAVREKALAGEAFDLIIAPPATLADLAKRKLIADGSERPLGLVRLGAAVKAGAPTPPLADPDEFKKAMLKASSIGLANPATGATSGIYLVKMLDQIGIGDAIRSKLKFYPEGQTAVEAVGRGEAEIGLGQISEILPVKGVVSAGPLPDALQLKTIYAGGESAASHTPEAARRLLEFLSGAEARGALRSQGFETTFEP